MRIVVDENLPPRLARALDDLFDEHEVTHLRTKFGPNFTDLEWIEALSAEGSWAVISSDRRISRNKAELKAFKASRLVGFFFPKSLEKAKLTRKMERLMSIWDSLEAQVALAAGGSMFEMPAKGSKFRTL